MKKKSIVVVLGIIENEKGEILLSLRNDPKFKGAHLKWDFVGGKVEMGESLEKTLRREIKEESGFNVKIESLIAHCICKNWNLPKYFQHTLVFCFITRKKSGKIASKDPKIKDLKWVTTRKALEMDLIFSARIFLKLYLKHRSKK
ncbi:MAG TPA: NUDIX hydrolase [Patescibacteria group bacterium]|nr:NUDIX hydrolase [Patescibacteria group bacterium]